MIDSLIDKGVVVDGEIVLGLADVDLVYVRLGALVAAADKVLGPDTGRRPRRRARRRGAAAPPPPSAALPAPRTPSAPPRRADIARPAPSAVARAPADTSDTSRSVIRLVLTVVELIRGLLERQAVRRVESGTLTPEETERLGRALMQLEDTVRQLAEQHGIDPASLNLDLGPLGRLR